MANHAHHAAHAPNVDKSAALMGLAGGLVFLVIVVYAIVAWTNSMYAGKEHGAPAAGASAPATH